MIVDEDDDEHDLQSNKCLSSDVSHILERADGSDNPGDDSNSDNEGEEQNMEEWEESAEEELSKH